MMKKIIMGLFMIVLMVMSSVAVMGALVLDNTGAIDDTTVYIEITSGTYDGDYVICQETDDGFDTKEKSSIKCGVYSKLEFSDDAYVACSTTAETDECSTGNTMYEYTLGSSDDSEGAADCNEYPAWCSQSVVNAYSGGDCEYLDSYVKEIAFRGKRTCDNGCDAGECLNSEGNHYGATEEEEEGSSKVPPSRPECSDGIDNDGDGAIDTEGGCDVNGDEELTSKGYVEEWDIYVDEVELHISPKIECEGYYSGVWYEADSVCTTGIGPKSNPDAGPNYDSESVIGVTAPSKYECADGLDNDGDGYVDYDNDNGGWCDVDNDGKITSKALSDYTEEWVIETDLTECECDNTHGYGDDICVTATPFLWGIFGGGRTTVATSPTTSGKAVEEDGNAASPFGRVVLLWITGKATRTALPVNAPDTDECSVDDDCEQRGKFGTECVDGQCETITSGIVTKPKKAATWYDYDPNCASPSDDDESGLIATPATGPDFGTTDDEEEPEVDYCSDGYDNDEDGLVDLDDPGCTNGITTVNAEYNRCGDGIDNDGDGYVDTADPECSDSGDDSERDVEETTSSLDDKIEAPGPSVSGGSETLGAPSLTK